MSDVLFEITKEQLETGLRGFPVGYCTTSHVDPLKGLFYVEKPVKDLAGWEPEEVIYLLYAGSEGKDLSAFKKELQKRGHCSQETLEAVCRLPRDGHPMALYAAALLILGMLEGKEDYREDTLNVIAKLPELTATVINHHAGWGKTPPSRPELGYMDNFSQMILAPQKSETLSSIFKLFNILHYDHGGGNLSTFVGKAVASGLEDLYGSLCAALNALAGPRHGAANQESLHFVQSLLDEVGASATLEEVERVLRQRLEKKEVIYGFGHAVLRVEDPRATVQYEVAEKRFNTHPLVKMALLIRKAGTKVLKENPKVSCPYPNVDAISGSLLSAAGFPYPEYYTVLFGLSRAVGISIQIIYERLEARGGKGTPIVRPKYLYKPR